LQQGVWANLQQFAFHTLKIIEAVAKLVNGQDLMIVNKVRYSAQVGLTSLMSPAVPGDITALRA
jgi:hypothetical protein